MPIFQVVSPYLVSLNANDLNSAVKQFAKTYYHMKINNIIIKDQIRNYRANLKYFKAHGRPRVGIRMHPYFYPVVNSTIPISQAFITPHPGNVVRSDGTIQEWNYSPTPSVVIKHTLTHKDDDKDDNKDDDKDDDKKKIVLVQSPVAPIMPRPILSPMPMPLSPIMTSPALFNPNPMFRNRL